jgi:ADP-heptose:LPS heptosyltransferase
MTPMNFLITLIFLPWLFIWGLIKKSPGKGAHQASSGSLLFIAGGGIGDTLLSLPAVAALKRHLPGLKATIWVSNRDSGVFFQEEKGVDSLLYYPFSRFFSPLRFFGENLKFLWKINRLGFSHVLVAEPSQNIISAIIGFISGAKIRIGPRYRLGIVSDTDFLLTHSLPFDYERHTLEMNLDLLRFLGIEDISPDFNFPLGEREKCVAETLIKEHGLLEGDLLIGMHIGANPNQLYKCWNPRKFAEVADFLSEDLRAKVVITGGEGEMPQVEKMMALSRFPSVNLVGQLGILETAALLARCDLFITNDSGPMHIAASVKTPVIAIFGPTRPKKNAPFGRHILVRKEMDCSPCYDWKFSRIAKCGHGYLKCLEDISVEDVKRAVMEILGKETKFDRFVV